MEFKVRVSLFFLFFLPLFASSLPLPVKYDPFHKAEKILKEKKVIRKIEKKPIKLTLGAIYNNKVYINGKFYKVGDRVGEYRVFKIAKDFVILNGKGKSLRLYLVERKIFKEMEQKR